MKSKKISKKYSKFNILLLSIVGLSLVMFQTAYWFNKYIADAKNFSQITTTALIQESSRNAIGDEVAEQIFKEKPILRQVAQEPVSNIVASMLNTKFASVGLEKMIKLLHNNITTTHPKSITFNLSQIKTVIQTVSQILPSSNNTQAESIQNIPDEITIIDKSSIPSLNQFVVAMAAVAPLSLLAATGAAVGYVVRKRKTWKLTFAPLGFSVMVASILGLLIGPIFKPPLIAFVSSFNGRIIVSNVFDGFMEPFNQQQIQMLFIGIILVFCGLIINYLVPLIRKKST